MRHSRRSFIAWAVTLAATAPAVAAGEITPRGFSAALALGVINRERARRNRPTLILDAVLGGMAVRQARHLARLKQMTHSPEGQQLRERAANAGYRGFVAENLADGYETFEEAVKAWIASGYHRTTMFSARYTRFGAAVAVAPDAVPGDWGIYWVTLYGA